MLRKILLAGTASLLFACAPEQTKPDHGTLFRDVITELQAESDVAGVGVVIVSGEEVILAEGFGTTQDGTPVTAETQCGLYSATKALTAFTLASLVETGDVDLNIPIGWWWTDAPDSWISIPLWRLYNHSSGIPMIINQSEFGAIASDPNAGNKTIVDALAPRDLEYQPGEFSRYRQSGYAVGEWLISDAMGQSWPALVEARLTGPAGATATEHTQLADGEKAVPMLTSAGFFRTTPSDMGAIFVALNTGEIGERGALSEPLLNPEYIYGGYGLGLIHETVGGAATIGHRGGGARANIRYAPDAGVGVMACTDQQDNDELTIRIADAVMAALLGEGELAREG